MEPGSQGFDPEAAAEFVSSFERETAFEQLLRLAASYGSRTNAGVTSAAPSAVRKSPLTEDIELRAYQIYLGRGATDGYDLEDWLQAERQVLDELKKSKASLRLALAFGLLKDFPEK